MKFLVRSARPEDESFLYELSQTAFLFNLPRDKKRIREKIEKSQMSCAGKMKKDASEYLFVLEDLREGCEAGNFLGSSQISNTLGTSQNPFYSFKFLREKRWNPFFKKEFEFEIYQMEKDISGFTEVGGLLVLPSYRRSSEKVGSVVSLSRFMYMACMKERFYKKVIARMAPVLDENKDNVFWKAFGEHFTRLSYREAIHLCLKGKEEEVLSLFPKEGERIYACLMDPKSSSVVFQMDKKAYPAFSLLKKIGFKESLNFEPFDGGLVVESFLEDIRFVKEGKKLIFKKMKREVLKKEGPEAFVGVVREGVYLGGRSVFFVEGGEVSFPGETERSLELSEGEEVYLLKWD